MEFVTEEEEEEEVTVVAVVVSCNNKDFDCYKTISLEITKTTTYACVSYGNTLVFILLYFSILYSFS